MHIVQNKYIGCIYNNKINQRVEFMEIYDLLQV